MLDIRRLDDGNDAERVVGVAELREGEGGVGLTERGGGKGGEWEGEDGSVGGKEERSGGVVTVEGREMVEEISREQEKSRRGDVRGGEEDAEKAFEVGSRSGEVLNREEQRWSRVVVIEVRVEPLHEWRRQQ